MVKLKKLIIKGIRSYGPYKEQVIDFNTPITLITGHNGTGKTTLIECLKYITTGVLPPNTKGGAFVYDGTLNNNTEVRAEIKLHIQDSYNREVVIHKILQSSIKQIKTEQKVLEHNVWINDKSNNTLGAHDKAQYKYNKLNKDDLMSIFEVNNCILENVVFCHQDDTLWYLAEPSVIKKKFDDIFNSTRYSKSLENLRKAKKDINLKVKVISTELSYLLKARNKRHDLEAKCRDMKLALEQKTDEYADLEKTEHKSIDILKNLSLEHSKIQVVLNKMKELSCSKPIKNIKYTEEECKDIISNTTIESKELEISMLESKIDAENTKIKILSENKKQYEAVYKEMQTCKNRQEQIQGSIQDNSQEINKIEDWLKVQETGFREKLNYDQNFDDYVEKFKFFIAKLDQQVFDKSSKLKDIKLECDRYQEELNDNNYKIKTLQSIINEPYDDEDFFEIDNLDDKILDLEKELENAIKMTRERICNEEKIKKRDEILHKLQNRTKQGELELIKHNVEQIKSYKLKLKKLGEFTNKINFAKTAISNKYECFDSNVKNMNHEQKLNERLPLNTSTEIDMCKKLHLDKSISNAKIELNNIYLEPRVANTLIEYATKNDSCFLCEKQLTSLKKYKNRILSICNNKNIELLKANKNNCKIIQEVNEILSGALKNIDKEFNILFNLFEESVDQFPKFITKLYSKIDEYNNELTNLSYEIDMCILDLEEDNVSLKNNVKMFEYIENLEIKNIKSFDIEKIQSEIKKHKNCKKIKFIKSKIIEYNELVLKTKTMTKLSGDLKTKYLSKKEKCDMLKSSIEKKKLEIKYKIREYEDKKSKLNNLHNDLNKVKVDMKSLTDKQPQFDFNNFSSIIECNLNNKNTLILLKNQLSQDIKRLEHAKEHLEYYKILHKNKKVKNEIRALEENLKTKYNSKTDNIILDYADMLKNKIDNINIKHVETLERKNIIKGEMQQMQNNVDSMSTELNVEYKDVVDKYNKKYAENKILELSSNDIDKCAKVLDKSIMDYHYNKIEEINLNLKELWTNCYAGTDIDTVKLTIKEVNTKNYSYRMMLVKNNVDLDMRNRSSAGQKMIGNILLRIALSKVFCTNFYILTLDEPTTNLDKGNVENLAYTLINIAKKNPNLQIIIITHDEDFLSIMCRESVDCYYRIAKNSHGYSVITKENV